MSDKASRIHAPFTEEQVDKLNKRQKEGRYHPYTCSRLPEECEVHTRGDDFSKDGVLKATSKGWVCPCGKYTQDWAHGV